MQERIDLVVAEEKRKGGGIAIAIGFSLLAHALLILWFVHTYRPSPAAAARGPVARYVELMRDNSQQFTESPGPAIEKAPHLNAPLSDANRKASTPKPTGDQPTLRPGDGSSLFTPPSAPRGAQASQQASMAPQPPQLQRPQSGASAAPQPKSTRDDTFVYHDSPGTTSAGSQSVDWKNAIREVGKVASLGGGDGLDIGKMGGDKGTAEQGPISFESDWYDWGEYAQSMVGRIRVNWYANMPQLLRTGLRGAVTIRFTIQRDGRITDVTILESSGVPPYDYAAKKAIELSSPLNALPKDFPNPTERVTCRFFYNMEPPTK